MHRPPRPCGRHGPGQDGDDRIRVHAAGQDAQSVERRVHAGRLLVGVGGGRRARPGARAIGTQTNGSVIRPAAYCGVVGFKPGKDLLPFAGVHRFSPTLDTLGVFARTVADCALLAGVLAGEGAIAPADDALRDAAGAGLPAGVSVGGDQQRATRRARRRRGRASQGGRARHDARTAADLPRCADAVAPHHAARGGARARSVAGSRARQNVGQAQCGAGRRPRDRRRPPMPTRW